MTYSELFEGQKVKFWPIDEKVPDSKVSVISISDLNRALAMQNKAPITLNDGQYLLNCNYNGTYRYIAAALQSHPEITVGEGVQVVNGNLLYLLPLLLLSFFLGGKQVI